MGPKITRHARVGGPDVTYNEGVREVGELEIRWRIPMAVRMTPDWSEGADWDAKVPTGEPVFEMVEHPAIVTVEGMGDHTMATPTNFETTIIDRARGRRYQLLIDADEHGPAIVGFSMTTAEDAAAPRSASDLKQMPFRRLLDESLATVNRVTRPADDSWRAGLLTRKDIEAARRPRGGRAPHDLARVAELHREAVDCGEPTSKYISRALSTTDRRVTPENARRLIMRARERGLVAQPGKED